MKTPVTELKATEAKREETPDGWCPIPFAPVELRPGQTLTIQISPYLATRGPFLFAFEDPSDLDVQGIRIGTHALEATDQPIAAATLVANSIREAVGDRFFAIDAPAVQPGQVLSLTLHNRRGSKRRVALTVYGRPSVAYSSSAPYEPCRN